MPGNTSALAASMAAEGSQNNDAKEEEDAEAARLAEEEREVRDFDGFLREAIPALLRPRSRSTGASKANQDGINGQMASEILITCRELLCKTMQQSRRQQRENQQRAEDPLAWQQQQQRQQDGGVGVGGNGEAENNDAYVWAPIAANAAMVAASVVCVTPESQRRLINAEDVCADLVQLLTHHPSAPARSRAAQALGLLAGAH